MAIFFMSSTPKLRRLVAGARGYPTRDPKDTQFVPRPGRGLPNGGQAGSSQAQHEGGTRPPLLKKTQWKAEPMTQPGALKLLTSAVLAGGGFKGGHVVGSSDAKGLEVAERPVYPLDLIGTMYELLGINPDGPMPNPRALDVKVLPSAGEDVQSGGRLKEIT